MVRSSRNWLALVVGISLPVACFAQTWTAGQDYALGGTSVRGMAAGEISAVHSIDVVVATDSGVWMQTGDGAGGLLTPSRIINGDFAGVAVGKFTDGSLDDLIVESSEPGGGLILYANRANLNFAAPIPIAFPAGVSGSCAFVAADLNGDGKADLAASCSSQPHVIFAGLNDGAGNFNFLPVATVEGRSIKSIAAGDFDGDKRIDLAVISSDSEGSLRGDVLWGTDGNSFILAPNVLPVDTKMTISVDFMGDGHSEIMSVSGSKIRTLQVSGSRAITELSTVDMPVGWEPVSGAAVLLQRGKDTSGVTAQDIAFGGTCGDLALGRGPCVVLLTNATATDLEISLPAKRSLGDPYTFTLSVRALHSTAIPSGMVVVWLGRSARKELPLSNGQATFKVMLPTGVETVAAGFMGGDGLSWAGAKRVLVVSPSEKESGVTQPQFAARLGLPIKKRPVIPSRWLDGTGGSGAAPHLALIATYPVSIGNGGYSPASPVNYGTAYTFNGSAQSTVDAYSQGYWFNCGVNFADRCYPPIGYLIPSGQPYFWVDGVSQGSVGYDYTDNMVVCGQDDTGRDMYCDNYTETFSWAGTLGTGAHTVTAQWINANAPDANSGTISWNVSVLGKASPSISVYCSPNPTSYGSGPTNCYSSLSGGASPTGNENWTINGGNWTTTGINGSTNMTFGAGSYTIGVTYSGDGNNNSASASTTLTINKGSRSISVDCSPNSTTYGSTHTTCTAQVSGGGGSITFTYNGTGWATVPISARAASVGGFDGAAPGTYNVVAVANGDSNYSDGASASTNYVVNKANRTVSVSCSPNPTTFGSTHTTCTAHASAGGGSMTFTYNGNGWTTVGIDGSGNAAVGGFDGAAAGTYNVVAVANGDGYYNDGASSSTNYFVNKATPSLSVWCNPNPATYGVGTTCYSSISGGTSGNLTWYVNGGNNGTTALNGSISGFTTATPQDYTVQAVYSGDGNYNSTSASTTLTINKANQSISITSGAPSSASYGSGFTVAATATSGLGVSYSASGGCTNSGANYTMTSGTTACTVIYNQAGNSNYNAASQVTQTVTALKVTPGVSVSCSPNPITYGSQTTTCTESQTAGTGSVAWTINGGAWTSTGVAGSAGGFAGYAVGNYTVGVAYSGDSNYNASSSSTVLSIVPSSQSITVTSAAPASAALGSQFSVAATASSGLAVTYGSSGGCTNNGATYTMTSATSACTVLFNQAGNSNYSAAAQITETVGADKALPTVSINSGVLLNQWGMSASGIGHSVGSANGANWVAAAGNAGMMQYGPYTTAVNPGGVNVATWSLMIDDNSSDNSIVAHIDITDNSGQVVLAQADVTRKQFASANAFQTFSLPFIAPSSPVGLELRLSSAGNSTLTESMVSLGGQTAAIFGQQVTLVASVGVVGGFVPTGTVTFYSNGSAIGSAPIDTSMGTATLATTDLAIGTDALTASYIGDINYQSGSSASLDQVISKATPTITTLPIASSITYGQTLTSSSLSGGVASVAGTFAWTTPGFGPSAGTQMQSVTFTPSDSAHYSSVVLSVSLNVDPAALSITPNAQTKTYGASLVIPTSAFTTSGLLNSDSVASVTMTSPGTVATAAVGSYIISGAGASGTGLSNYTITYNTGTLTVTKAILTVTANNAAMTYGGLVPSFTASYSGFANGDTPAVLSGAPLLTTTATSATDIGSYVISCNVNTLSAANYSFVCNDGTLVINAAPLSITPNAQSKIYGATLAIPTTAFTTSGLLNSDSVTSVILSSPGTAATAGVGSYPISAAGASGTGLSNYAITYNAGTLTVTKASLTVTANNASMTYGGAVPSLTVSYSGFENGDTTAVISGAPSLTTTASSSTGVGSYVISCDVNTLSAANYSFVCNDGTLAINTAPLAITPSSQTKIYGATLSIPTNGFTVSGLLNSDSVASVALTSPGTAATAAVGSYTISGASAAGLGLGNYSITYNTGTLTVSKAVLTVTAKSLSMSYGAIVPSFSPIYSGFQNGEDVSVLSGAPVLTSAATSSSPIGPYTITCDLGTLSTQNYTFACVDGVLTISKATPLVGLVSSLNPSTYMQSVTFTATVPTGTTGTVTFMDGALVLGTAPLSGNTAMLATSGLNGGSHSITAQYNGDSNNNPSASDLLDELVKQAPIGVAGSSNRNLTTYGDSVSFAFNFVGSGMVPTGTATISVDGVAVSTVTLDASGTAIYTTSTLGSGDHTVVATYDGDANYF